MDRTDAHTSGTRPARAPRTRRALAPFVANAHTVIGLLLVAKVASIVHDHIHAPQSLLIAGGVGIILGLASFWAASLTLPQIGLSLDGLAADTADAVRSEHPRRTLAAIREVIAAERALAAVPAGMPYSAESEMFLEANRRVELALANPYLPDRHLDPRDTLIYGDCIDEQQVEDFAVGDRVQVINPRWAWEDTEGLFGDVESITDGLIAVKGIDGWFRERFLGRRGYTAAELYRLQEDPQPVSPEL